MRWPSPERPDPKRVNPAAREIGQFMRDRREALGLSVRDMARALGVSEPYIYLLETGRKELHYGMALQMTRFLRISDERLLEWVRRHRPRSYLAALEDQGERGTLEGGSMPERSERPAPEDLEPEDHERPHEPRTLNTAARYLEQIESRYRSRYRRERSGGLLQIPFLEPGRLPDEDAGAPTLLPIDARLLPDEAESHDLLAYRVDWRMARRVSDVLAEDDVVILTREVWPLHPGAVYAVDMSGVVELARVSKPRDYIVVEDGPDSRHQGVRIELADLHTGGRPHERSRLVGRVITTVRRSR